MSIFVRAESGHAAYVSELSALKDDYAHLISSYILSSSNHCIRFFYALASGVLSLRVTSQSSGLDEIVWSVRADGVNTWHKAYVQLPEGYESVKSP